MTLRISGPGYRQTDAHTPLRILRIIPRDTIDAITNIPFSITVYARHDTTHTHDKHIYRISSTTYILYTRTILIKKTNKPTNRTEPNRTENRTERADIIGSFEFSSKQDRICTNTLNQTIFYPRKNTKNTAFVRSRAFPSFFSQRERKGRGRVGVCARTLGRDSSFVITDVGRTVGRSVGSGRFGSVFSTSTRGVE